MGTWAFGGKRAAAHAEWSKIPIDTQLLVTHGPPSGMCDTPSGATTSARHLGDVSLLWAVTQRVRPSHHIFGHIHDGYGVVKRNTTAQHDATVFVNAANMKKFSSGEHRLGNVPIILDIERG